MQGSSNPVNISIKPSSLPLIDVRTSTEWSECKPQPSKTRKGFRLKSLQFHKTAMSWSSQHDVRQSKITVVKQPFSQAIANHTKLEIGIAEVDQESDTEDTQSEDQAEDTASVHTNLIETPK